MHDVPFAVSLRAIAFQGLAIEYDSFPALVQANIAQTAERYALDEEPEWEIVTLPGFDAAEVEFMWAASHADGRVAEVVGIEYVLARGHDVYLLSFTVMPDVAADYQPGFRQVAGSMEVAGFRPRPTPSVDSRN